VPVTPFERSEAPWTEDQVASLNGWQACGLVHPFTYGDGEDQVDLVATKDGWVAAPSGPVVQSWAHAFMADWSWRSSVHSPDNPSPHPVKCVFCDSMTTTGVCANCAEAKWGG